MKLRTRLTASEIETKREAIVGLLSERGEIDDRKKEAAKEFREALKDLDKRIEGLRAEALEGYDLREVEVDERVVGRRVEIFRTDTGETVSRRNMTATEKEAREAIEEPDEPDEDEPEDESAPPQARGQGDAWDDVESAAEKSQ